MMSTPIEGDADRFDSHPPQERLAWETPALTVVHVEKATQGGGGDLNDQDDVFYQIPS